VNRVSSFLKNLFRVNPIIVKEIRSRMRGPRAFITLTIILALMGGLMFAMLQIILVNSRYTTVLSPQIGQGMFGALAFLLLFMISAVTPAVTAGAISGEKEKQTYEMLISTPLSPSSILWGKLISALSYVLLLLFAAVPLASVVFIFGGVAPADMLKTLVLLLVIAITFGVLGLFMSALFGRTGRATVASFLTVALLMIGPLFVAGLVGILRQAEPPRWILAPSPISALSAVLASTMGRGGLGDVFFFFGGIFNMGIAPMSQFGIPRPLYHYSLPFFGVLSLILYMVATRLVQPTHRWRLRRKEILAGVGTLVVVIALIVGAFLVSANRYEWAANPNAGMFQQEVFTEVAVPVPAIEVKEGRAIMEPVPPELQAAAGEVTPDSQGQIYAAIASRMYTTDHSMGPDQRPAWPVLYVMSVTDDRAGDPGLPTGNPQQIDPQAQEVLFEHLLKELNVKARLVETKADINIDPQTGAVDGGQGAVITLGNIYPQEDGTVQVSASLYFASEGAGGKTFILAFQDGRWVITGTTGVQWMS
jgi:ABC-2 type transport system permease protein